MITKYINGLKIKLPSTPKEWVEYDIAHCKTTEEKDRLVYSSRVGKSCGCGDCYCCFLYKRYNLIERIDFNN